MVSLPLLTYGKEIERETISTRFNSSMIASHGFKGGCLSGSVHTGMNLVFSILR